MLLGILSSHPRLGAAKVESAQSAAEQAKLQQGSEEEGRLLAELNQEYERVFPGLRFVVWVNGRGRREIMEIMRERIERGTWEGERDGGIEVSNFFFFSFLLLFLSLSLSFLLFFSFMISSFRRLIFVFLVFSGIPASVVTWLAGWLVLGMCVCLFERRRNASSNFWSSNGATFFVLFCFVLFCFVLFY